jgi:hypothetical protein
MYTDQQIVSLLDTLFDLDNDLTERGMRQTKARILVHVERYRRLHAATINLYRLGLQMEKFFDNRPPGNGPSHRHKNPPKWDHDGSTCEWCAAWITLNTLLSEMHE